VPWSAVSYFEQSVFLALDYLIRSGEIGDLSQALECVERTIARLARQGERRPMALANRAIDSYRRSLKP